MAAGKSRGIEVQTIASEVQNVCSGTRAVLAKISIRAVPRHAFAGGNPRGWSDVTGVMDLRLARRSASREGGGSGLGFDGRGCARPDASRGESAQNRCFLREYQSRAAARCLGKATWQR